MSALAHIDRLSAWLAATDIAVLELTGPQGSVRLERRGAQIHVERAPPSETCKRAPPTATRSHTISAQSPGIFLHHHPLHTAPLVAPGDRIVTGQAIGLLRIRSLLLPVRAPFAGLVKGFWVAHGEPVGYGTDLVEIESETRE